MREYLYVVYKFVGIDNMSNACFDTIFLQGSRK